MAGTTRKNENGAVEQEGAEPRRATVGAQIELLQTEDSTSEVPTDADLEHEPPAFRRRNRTLLPDWIDAPVARLLA